jgi:NitT/TauT family transport system substrate-binding protein
MNTISGPPLAAGVHGFRVKPAPRNDTNSGHRLMSFRILRLGLALLWLANTTVQAEPAIRVGSLRYGTLSWELDVIAQHGLSGKHGVQINTLELAGAPAGQLALQAGRIDLIVSDWLWVSRQRADGADLTFVPFSNAIGSLIVPIGSTIRDIPDLAGRRLGIAGSAIDKSWLLLRLYARSRFDFDIDANVDKSFGAPPLLSEELEAGRLDAVLTYWPFAAKLEARGMRPVLGVGDALAALGVPRDLPLTGYVFFAGWAAENRAALDGFLAASREAKTILDTSDEEWQRIAPLTGARDKQELTELRDAYRQGIPRHWTAEDTNAAARLYRLLAEIGGPALVGPGRDLAPGTFLADVKF